jgi:hypothetical protein
MKRPLPITSSFDEMKIDLGEIEGLLQGYSLDMPEWPEATVVLRDGRTLYLRSMRDDDIDILLPFMEKVMKVEKDFYDIVGVRVYGEILAVRRKRLKDPFTILGLIDGEFVGFANGRAWNQDLAIGLHTMAFSRRGRIGWAMYYAKTYYAMELLKAKEWWSTFESYSGWRMAGLAMAQPTKMWPEYQHELGGAKVYVVTQESWQRELKGYLSTMVNTDLNFNVPDEVRKANENFHVPETLDL